MDRILRLGALLAPLCAATSAAIAQQSAASGELDEIVVTATMRSVPQNQLPGSATVLDSATLRAAGQQNFEDVVALVPNLNWAGDTSLPRYFQIRGIGELQQYQGAPNPSVGFLIDDVDFSGLGGIATLFDVDHIEVLHGPQATLYGANALAGMIYVRSAEPENTFGGRAEFSAGNYATQSYGAVLTGPVEALDSSFRLAAERYFSNGFYYNAYVQAPTDERDDMTARFRWRYQPSAQLQVDFSLLHVSIDNGYDQWTINNSRTTESNDPGVDNQDSTGVSMRAVYDGLKDLRLTAIATYADSRINYSYDGDWGNPRLWAPYTYEYTEDQMRDRSTRSLELRLGTTAVRGFGWLFGVYAFGLRESLTDTSAGIYVDPFDPTQNSTSLTILNSTYSSTNAALYGQLDGDLGARGRWSLGLRGERHTTDYNDTTANLDAPTTANSFSPAENLWGGHASVDWQIAEGQHLYALLARGYKAGGFNLSPGLPPDEVYFGPESDLNFEIGHKARLAGGALELQTSLFYIYRRSPQLLTGTQFDPDNPDTFVFYTGNAASGYNYGLEGSLAWRAGSRLQIDATLGLLQTQYRGFVQSGVVLPDRELPDAPNWQAALAATWRDPRGAYLRLDLTGMGAFYYDMPPNPTSSRPYGLVNAKLGWQQPRYEVYWYGRNLLNKEYPVRGFYFGDVPPNFPNQTFVQYGDPFNWGVHLTVWF